MRRVRATTRTWWGAQSIPVLALRGWRSSRGSSGSLGSRRATVVLHRLVGCLLGTVFGVWLTEVRNLRINHTEFSNLLKITPTASVQCQTTFEH